MYQILAWIAFLLAISCKPVARESEELRSVSFGNPKVVRLTYDIAMLGGSISASYCEFSEKMLEGNVSQTCGKINGSVKLMSWQTAKSCVLNELAKDNKNIKKQEAKKYFEKNANQNEILNIFKQPDEQYLLKKRNGNAWELHLSNGSEATSNISTIVLGLFECIEQKAEISRD
ncbi:MAG: hypothetical protein WCI18_03990 [Pseudomonadota bacterium]